MIRAFRPINLVVIVLVCLVFNFLSLELRETSLGIYSETFISYVIAAVLIGASGYLINGYLDREIDKINHPKYTYPMSKQQTYFIYIVLVIFTLLIGFYEFSWKFNLAFIILPIIALLLYSLFLKKVFILGNLTVAFIALLLPIGLLFLNHTVTDLRNEGPTAQVTMALLCEIFLITLAREIIKDIQDIKGDKKMNCKTLPIISGEKTSAIVSSVLLTIGGLIWFNIFKNTADYQSIAGIILNVFVLITLFTSILLLWMGKEWKKRAKMSSLTIKTAMIMVLITVVLH